MARINIEDRLDGDIRFQNLIIKLGCPDRALGALVRAWKVAQKFYLSSGLIPEADWKSQGCKDELIDVGLAERRAVGVYMKGADEQFSWLKQRSEAGQKNRKNRKNRERPLTADERPTSNDSRETSSFSFSFSKKEEERVHVDSPSTHPLVEIWNSNCGNLPKVSRCGKARLKQASTRFRENSDREFWKNAVLKLARSSFCNGNNERGWKATFDFLLKPETANKAIEGTYDNSVSNDKPKLVLNF